MGASAEQVGRVAKSMGYGWCFHFVLMQNGCSSGAIMKLLDVAMFSPSFVAIYVFVLLDTHRCMYSQLFVERVVELNKLLLCTLLDCFYTCLLHQTSYA